MLTRLLESKRTRDRSAGGTVASVLAHAAVIGLVAYATLGAAPRDTPAFHADTVIFVTPVPTHTLHPVPAGPRCGASCRPLPPAPTTLPPVVDPVPPLPPLAGVGTEPVGATTSTQGPDSAAGGDGGARIFEIVEEPAAPLPGNPRPVYPSLLRATRVSGVVSARFVVDTAGRVEPASVAFDGQSDRLFQEAVRRALTASRYTPAVTQGRRVRMLVRQEFAFRITP